MPSDWELLITGCGTSHGNPPWGYPQLWSEDPRDLRRRAGAVLTGSNGQVLLIDAGPDLQHQMRDPDRTWDGRSYPAKCIVRCDAVLLTHDHADHSHGFNDLRHLNRLMGGVSIRIFGAREHLDAVQTMFPFCFGEPDKLYYLGSPALASVAMHDGTVTDVAGLPVVAFPMSHGPAGRTTGFRCGGMAWLTDLKVLPPEADAHLRDLATENPIYTFRTLISRRLRVFRPRTTPSAMNPSLRRNAASFALIGDDASLAMRFPPRVTPEDSTTPNRPWQSVSPQVPC